MPPRAWARTHTCADPESQAQTLLKLGHPAPHAHPMFRQKQRACTHTQAR